MSPRIALLFGSTGMIGNLLLEELLRSELYSRVIIFVRKAGQISNARVEEIVMDFSSPEQYSGMIKGNDIFICLGSTIKKAGSVANFEKIDRDLPLKLASIAKANGVEKVAVISSVGANRLSGNYYLRVKGEMEQGILDLNFSQCVIARPSMLLGERNEKRFGESLGKVFMKIINPFISGKFRKYKAIPGHDVARAMIAALQESSFKTIYESDELQELSYKYQQ